ncbi:multidrug efflux MFS transporter [Paenibacillus polymyxa]|nr:multidrug efflux MFS transporter [Paenibacillus polymyxa]
MNRIKGSISGLIISLGSFTMALMAPVWGNLSDAKGRKLMILLGSLFLIAGMASFLISASLVVYYAVFFMFGIGTGLMMPRFRGGPN